MNALLWVLQVLLALEFLFAGGVKFVTPMEEMTSQMPVPLPGWLLLFIGACEVLGATGLILPWLLRIQPRLTPLAALGLTIIMAGAVVLTLMSGMGAAALIPLGTGLLTAVVAYGRSRPAPAGPS